MSEFLSCYYVILSWMSHFSPEVNAALITIIGIIAAAVLALGGVWLGLQENRKALLDQHLLEFRRRVYSDASEAMALGLSSIQALFDPTTPLTIFHKAAERLTQSCSKINLIAQEDAMEAFGDYLLAINEQFSGIVLIKARFEFQQRRLDFANRLLSMQIPDGRRQMLLGIVNRAIEESNRLEREMIQRNLDFSNPLESLAQAATIAFRDELESHLDPAFYRQERSRIVIPINERAQQAIRELVEYYTSERRDFPGL